MTCPCRCRRGYSLPELLVSLVIAAALTAATLQGLAWLVSVARLQMEREETQQNARVVVQLLAEELRGAPPGALAAIAEDSVVLRGLRAWAIVCSEMSEGLALLVPTSPAVPVTELLGGGIDSIAVERPGGSWAVRGAEHRTAASATAEAEARCAALEPRGGAGTFAARAFRVESPPAGAQTARAYLFETVQYSARRVGGHRWIYRSFGSLTNLQPLAGPVDSLDGFRLEWLDEAGGTAATPAEVRGARIRVVTTSSRSGSATATADTLGAAAMLRSIP